MRKALRDSFIPTSAEIQFTQTHCREIWTQICLLSFLKCYQHMAYAEDNYRLCMLPIYKGKRTLLFDCIYEALSGISTESEVFIQKVKSEWIQVAQRVATAFPKNKDARIEKGEIILRRPAKKKSHKDYRCSITC